MKVFLVLFLLASSLAQAVEVKVSETPADHFRPNAKATFEVNKEAGRAWIEVKMYDHEYGDAGAGASYTREKVPGLVYDQTSSTITLTHEGQVFECATVTRRWYGTIVRPTGCMLQTKKVKLTYDDGYQTYKRDYVQVNLLTK